MISSQELIKDAYPHHTAVAVCLSCWQLIHILGSIPNGADPTMEYLLVLLWQRHYFRLLFLTGKMSVGSKVPVVSSLENVYWFEFRPGQTHLL